MEDCIFCKIANKKCDAKILYEDDISMAFEDINPQAPVHILVIPKKHIRTILDIQDQDLRLIGHLINVANNIARKNNISEDGFRLVLNCGSESGQYVWHVHFHLMGGRKMTWPPG